MRVGKRQIELLITLATPNRLLVVGDKISDALVRRGMLKEDQERCGIGITAAGLRALADAMDRGEVSDALQRMKQDFDARREKVRSKR